MKFSPAPDLSEKIFRICEKLKFSHIDAARIKCYRSTGSSSRAIARIWSLPKIWQDALKIKPHYVLEVISEKFDSQPEDEKIKILIHELMHIPKNFSGAVLSHNTVHFDGAGGFVKKKIGAREVEKLFEEYKKTQRLL